MQKIFVNGKSTELKIKEQKAIEALKMFEPEDEPYYLCYSGGKDSDVIRILAQLAGVKHEIHHNLTTVDAPETIAYIKSIPNVQINKARWSDGSHKTMWNLIPYKKMPPSRLMRYCCVELKEQGGKGRLKITGVRAAESRARAANGGDIKIIGKPKTTEKFLTENDIQYSTTDKGGLILNFDNADSRRAVEHCFRTTSTMINPILGWSEAEVWEFLHHYGCEANPLYQCDKKRIGCIGCPMQGRKNMRKEFSKYPKYYYNYIRAFDKMIKAINESGKITTAWQTGEEVMRWWVSDAKEIAGQTLFEGFDLLDV